MKHLYFTFPSKLRWYLIPLMFGLFITGLEAQTYCGATSSWGCGYISSTQGYGGDLTDVTVKNSAGGTLASYTGITCSGGGLTVLNAGNPFDVTSGESLTFNVTGTKDAWGYGWNTNVGVWIDLDRDGNFSTAENIIDPQSGALNGTNPTNPTTATVKIPCSTSTGKSRIRLRSGSTLYSTYLAKTNGCGTVNGYGQSLDFEIDLKLGSPPIANFIVPPAPNYVKVPITFNSTTNATNYTYSWKFFGGTVVSNGTPKGKGKWATAGTYDVQLLMDYCGLKDSIIKQVVITTPTAVPKADFIASANEVEVYYDVQMLDLSTNGAYSWSWEATSPTGNVYTSTQQNPYFNLDEIGKWSFCLTSSNDVGPSTKVCKMNYVECTPPSEFYLGPNKEAGNRTGTLYDNGGPSLPYGANRKVTIDYFKIFPCGASEIRLSFKSLKLADANDKLRIYDAAQEDPSKLLTPADGINGGNQNTYRNTTFKATSGTMYITFESNGSGQDSGFIAVWDADLAPAQNPVAGWSTDYNPAANGMQVDFKSTVAQGQGAIAYEWFVDGNSTSTNENYSETFFTDGTYQICLAAVTCNGGDTFCSTIDIFTPNAPGALDFTASNLRPKVNEVVTFTTTTDYANQFEWSIFPTTFQYLPGFSSSSKNPQIRFTAGGPYTFTLKGWNSVGGQVATERKVIKNKYIVVLDPCTPLVDLLSSDVGINLVELSEGSNVLLTNTSTSGDVPYTDYSTSIIAQLKFGGNYTVDVSRKTSSNSVNYKVWIDFNIDGIFQPAEQVLSSGVISGTSASANFQVPTLANSFEGSTRMRVGVSYNGFANNPCGVNTVGEFEDYGIVLSNDGNIPIITLYGGDTVRVEKTLTANGCWQEVAGSTYSASDATQGDMTGAVVLVSDLDCTVPGIYSIDFNVMDASGNNAATRRRTVIVVLDKTAPILTLNDLPILTIEQCATFTDPGAIATDLVDGNLTTAIITTGSVDAGTVGDYTLVYTVADAQGNTATASRLVMVRDTKNPGIFLRGVRIVDNTTINVQILSTFVDEVYGDDYCNGAIPVTKTPGFNGLVNTQARATYPIVYTSQDPSGNLADENGFTINYKVDDFIAPDITLNTEDTIYIDVNNPYVSRNVTVSDNYYAMNKVSVVKTGSVDPYKLGKYVETYTATDESGNVTVKTRTVVVVDRIAPVLLAPAMNACVGDPFWAMSGLVVEDNYYSPASLLPLVKVLNHNVNIWVAGVYYINYELTDPSGNRANLVSRTVSVTYAPNCQNTFVSTKVMSLEELVKISPNPTTDAINVDFSLQNTKPVMITVYDQAGRVMSSVTASATGMGTERIDLSGFASGLYRVAISNDGQSVTKSVIKN